MSQLELLWKLENQKILLETQRKELDLIRDNRLIANMKSEIEKFNEELLSLSNKVTQNKLRLKETNDILNNHIYKLEKIDFELYNGEITDLKQLDFLSNEKDNMKELISEVETTILVAMDELEDDELKISKLENDLIIINKDIAKDIKSNELALKRLENSILKDEKILETLELDIDDNILNRYNVLRKTRKNAVVQVKNHICTGCNMHIPTVLRDTLRAKLEIIYCESCGRILYYVDEE